MEIPDHELSPKEGLDDLLLINVLVQGTVNSGILDTVNMFL